MTIENPTRLGIQLEKETKQQLKEKAQDKGITLSSYTRMIIRENLE